MTPEEIKRFRDEVAEPRMKKLLDNTVVPEGFCCIDNVEISFIDGRSWGIDSQFKASGLMFAHGKVEAYEFDKIDIGVSEFVEAHKGCVFLSGGSLKISDELEEFDMNTNISNLRGVCLKLFEDFECARYLTYVMSSPEYLKMISVGLDANAEPKMNVYLIPGDDATYSCCLSDDAPSAEAIFLMKEGDYPVLAMHERHDLNMDRLLAQETIIGREDLVKYLDFLGECRHALLSAWDYDIDKTAGEDLLNLFDVCYARKAELIGEEIAMMEEVPKEYLETSGLKAVDIVWDVNCEMDREVLPTEIDIPYGMVDMAEIIDYLSNVTGFCHEGFMVVDANGARVEFDGNGVLELKGDSLESKIACAEKENQSFAMNGAEVLKKFREGDFGCR